MCLNPEPQALRVLRAIKPLRALTRSEGMRLVFVSVTRSVTAMANVSIVVVLFILIFAILGVQLFAGKFYRCAEQRVARSPSARESSAPTACAAGYDVHHSLILVLPCLPRRLHKLQRTKCLAVV